MRTYLVYPTDEQEKFIEAFMEALNISFVKEDAILPPHVLNGISKSQEDIKAGRTITLDEFKKRFSYLS